MDFTFEITNINELERFFDVIKTIDFEQLREAIKKVEQDMEKLSTINMRIMDMNDNDIMWDPENRRIKIKINKTEKERVPKEIHCANLGAFNALVIKNELEGVHLEYPEFLEIRNEYMNQEFDGKSPSVMTLIDGLVETLKNRYGVKLKNFKQIEELQKVDPKRRKMHASLRFFTDAKNQVEANGVTSPTLVIKPSDIGPR